MRHGSCHPAHTRLSGAAKDAVAGAGKTVRGMRWARVSEFDLRLKDQKTATNWATVRNYFDVEH